MFQRSKPLQLPPYFEMYRNQLEQSALPTALILPQRNLPTIVESKFAGFPYLPKYHSYPKDIFGNYMHFLAQINFSDVAIFDHFPSSGILQFFISPSVSIREHEMYEDVFQQLFKVRYYPNVYAENELIHNFSFLPSRSNSNFPIDTEMTLLYTTSIEPVSATDYRLTQYLQFSPSEQLLMLEDGRSFEEHYIEHFLSAEHKIGGYPYFIYNDPRRNSTFLRKYDTLLLQIVSNDAHGIMWGDSGILKFFINKEKLMQKDFSDIYFLTEQY